MVRISQPTAAGLGPIKTVRIIVTGGTIDKIHDPLTESLAFASDGSSHLPEILKMARCDHPVVEKLMLKDSLDFDESDREAIGAAVTSAAEDAIVITHGTGTMEVTARWLAERLSGKTVVLTGAMRPHSLGMSDGPFNLGGAIIAAQILQPGVYGVMNGRVFAADALRKNTDAGRFDV